MHRCPGVARSSGCRPRTRSRTPLGTATPTRPPRRCTPTRTAWAAVGRASTSWSPRGSRHDRRSLDHRASLHRIAQHRQRHPRQCIGPRVRRPLRSPLLLPQSRLSHPPLLSLPPPLCLQSPSLPPPSPRRPVRVAMQAPSRSASRWDCGAATCCWPARRQPRSTMGGSESAAALQIARPCLTLPRTMPRRSVNQLR